MPIIQAQAAGASRRNGRHAALEAIKNPANWWRPGSVRHHLRRAIGDSGLPPAVQQFGMWLSDRLTDDGELYRGTLADVMRLSPLPDRTAYKYLAQLERAGLVERHGSARRIGPGEYRRYVLLRAAAEIRGRAQDSTAPAIQARDLQNCTPCRILKDKGVPTVVDGSVGGRPQVATRARARNRPSAAAIDEAWRAERERELVRDHWPLLARSRTDLPGFRPGYGDNITLDPEARARLGIRPPREYLPVPEDLAPEAMF